MTYSYADQAAIDAHKASPKLAWLQEISIKEGIMAAPLKVIPLEQFTGFESRL
jgi:quinol monooxygenase YgiN